LSSSTAIRKVLALGLAAVALSPALFGQWRETAARLVGSDKQYAKAAAFILSRWSEIADVDKADAAGLLAYCFQKTGDFKTEIKWAVDYFEIYGTKDSGFVFLDLISQSEVIGYLNGWRMKFPWVNGVSMIKAVSGEIIMPEGILPLVVEITNPALFKFSEGGAVLKAGALNAGFNIIALDANTLFLGSGRHIYRLEVKAAGFVLAREIVLDVDIASTRPKPVLQSQAQTGRPLEYQLTLFIDGRAVMSSRKTVRSTPLDIGVKPSKNPFGFKPDYMLNRDKPDPFNSLNLVQIIPVLLGLLKDLFKSRGKKDAEPPKIETVRDLTLNFNSRDFDGLEYVTKATLKLTIRSLPAVVNSP
jgi:hypothetical protein